ncbi:flagellar motor protein MotB [Tepidibacter formicigenes]|jgi:chemotaxis protein MotB|uniref:Chemotaxis protein MotB n=1 Tax=Tepidibacter formicigenes DSM 15518 TaxID=1123349 RepID=A0A1M6J9M6_9FIRM|nr:flagellar motor protein MotB [Tepidibacter formicigenes]SHJ43408.1 chemotaxis protein MotB [Tepidibacter formicigenes DSM 15518]
MPRKKKEEEVKQGAPEWMGTYGDMVTLLLCFFVLLFSMSSVDAQKFQAIIQSFNGSLGFLDGGKTLVEEQYIDKGLRNDKSIDQKQETENFNNLEKQIKDYLNNNGLDKDVSVMNESVGLLLRFQDNILFDSGKADLKSNSQKTLRYISTLLNKNEFKDKFIRIEGHTDNDPIRYNSKYPTNWELSVARSSNVVRFLVESTDIDPKRISASGYSEYHPVAPNDSPQNKAKNRRVDILILKTQFVKDEPTRLED